MKALTVLIITITALSKGQVISRTPNQLQPVSELYIKPSVDGTTGDLYVAATEESGTTTQWLTHKPVHFLQPHSQETNYANSFNTKRAIVSPHANRYAQLQARNSEVNASPGYPYALATAAPTQTTPAETKIETPCNTAETNTQFNPYNYFYPQIMSSYANMANILQDAGISEESANSLVPQSPALWPQTYAYPVQYMMVDPNTWALAQATSPTSPTSVTESNN